MVEPIATPLLTANVTSAEVEKSGAPGPFQKLGRVREPGWTEQFIDALLDGWKS